MFVLELPGTMKVKLNTLGIQIYILKKARNFSYDFGLLDFHLLDVAICVLQNFLAEAKRIGH